MSPTLVPVYNPTGGGGGVGGVSEMSVDDLDLSVSL